VSVKHSCIKSQENQLDVLA